MAAGCCWLLAGWLLVYYIADCLDWSFLACTEEEDTETAAQLARKDTEIAQLLTVFPVCLLCRACFPFPGLANLQQLSCVQNPIESWNNCCVQLEPGWNLLEVLLVLLPAYRLSLVQFVGRSRDG